MKKKFLLWTLPVFFLAILVFFSGKQAMSTEEILPGKIVFHTYRDPKTGDIALLENGQIQTIEKVASDPRWSNDGKKLLYLTGGYKDSRLIIIDHKGGETLRIPVPAVGVVTPTWLSDSKILFMGYDFGNPKSLKDNLPGIYAWNVQKGKFSKVFEFEVLRGRTILDMDVSIAAKKIAIADSILYLGNFENDRVSDFVKIGYAEHVRFSPDGRKLAFSSIYDQKSKQEMDRKQIFVIDLETKQVTQLTNNQWDNIDPCWSPDGKQILFVSGRLGSSHTMGSELFVMDADGKNERQVTKAVRLGQMIGVGPLWSRDQNPDWAP